MQTNGLSGCAGVGGDSVLPSFTGTAVSKGSHVGMTSANVLGGICDHFNWLNYPLHSDWGIRLIWLAFLQCPCVLP